MDHARVLLEIYRIVLRRDAEEWWNGNKTAMHIRRMHPYHRALAWFGQHLIQWGVKLYERYSETRNLHLETIIGDHET